MTRLRRDPPPAGTLAETAAAELSETDAANCAKVRSAAPRTFGRRLAFAFATVAALTAILAGLLLAVVWNYQFDRYLRDNLQRFSDGVAAIVGAYYPVYGFDYRTIGQIPMLGPTSNVGVQVLSPSGQLIYDEATMRRHMQTALQQGGATLPSLSATDTTVLNPHGHVATSRIIVSGHDIGTVRVWAYGGAGALLSERDMKFREGSLVGLAVAAIVAIVLASFAGAVYSRRLARPIENITETAQALRCGEHNARTGLEGLDEIGFLGKALDDMADSIEADRELERRLTMDVAHELRTPLQAIQATVEAMQDGVMPADEEHLGIVRDETVRLGRLAGGILELSRLENGSVQFRTSRIDLAVPVRAALDSHAAMLETVDVQGSAEIVGRVFVLADPDRLQQAVGNLLSNAARYTPAGGRVDVRTKRDGDYGLIEVADTGIGIAEEDIGRVFSRFWRADAARERSSGGLGIGLAVTKEIVERFGGTIEARRREGGGTVFEIRLPLA